MSETSWSKSLWPIKAVWLNSTDIVFNCREITFSLFFAFRIVPILSTHKQKLKKQRVTCRNAAAAAGMCCTSGPNWKIPPKIKLEKFVKLTDHNYACNSSLSVFHTIMHNQHNQAQSHTIAQSHNQNAHFCTIAQSKCQFSLNCTIKFQILQNQTQSYTIRHNHTQSNKIIF